MAKTPTIQNKIDLLRMQRSATSWYRKDAPYVWPDFRSERPQYQIVDFESYVSEGFNINSLVYSAIMYKARAMYQVPLRAYTGDEDHPEPLPPDHPLSKLVRRPNMHQSFAEFQGLQHVYLNLSGNSYTYLDRDSPDELPKGLYPLRPDRVFIVPKKSREKLTEDALLGYLYVPEGTSAWVGKSQIQRENDIKEGKVFPILPQNMLHVKFPNPGDPLEGMGYGLAPLSPAAKSVDVDNKVTDFLNIFFKQGTMMMGVLSYDVPLDPNMIPGIRKKWQELYGGYENWANVGILDQGGKYQRVTPTFDEMGFGELDERSETRALGPFGVPPILVGARIGLLRSTYCLPANARITTSTGPKFIVDIEPGDRVWSLVDGTLVLRDVIKQHRTGSRRIYKIKTKNRTLRASGNHPVLVRVGEDERLPESWTSVSYGWRRVDDLTIKDYVVQLKEAPDWLLKAGCCLIELDGPDKEDAQEAGLSDELGFYKIHSIETEEIEDVYDIEVEDGHSFIADGVVVHNSNFEQARKLCWEETLVPEANLFLVEYRDKLSFGDAFVGWDYTKVPAMRQNLEELAKVWAMLVQNGVPKDIASAVTGLDIPPLLDGQVIYMQANLIPVGEEGQPSRLWPGQQLLPLGEAAQEETEEEDAEKLWKLVKKKHN